jgi:hypothetical protein
VFLLEGVGNVFEEDQAEDNVFVVGGVEVAAELVGSGPEGGFKTEVALAVAILVGLFVGSWRLRCLTGCRGVSSSAGRWRELVDQRWTRAGGVARKGHFANSKLCARAAHDVKSGNDAPKRGKWKGESGEGKR